jgi:hypothetical protein
MLAWLAGHFPPLRLRVLLAVPETLIGRCNNWRRDDAAKLRQ